MRVGRPRNPFTASPRGSTRAAGPRKAPRPTAVSAPQSPPSGHRRWPSARGGSGRRAHARGARLAIRFALVPSAPCTSRDTAAPPARGPGPPSVPLSQPQPLSGHRPPDPRGPGPAGQAPRRLGPPDSARRCRGPGRPRPFPRGALPGAGPPAWPRGAASESVSQDAFPV